MPERACCCDEASDQPLPIAVAFWVTRIVSAEECSSLMQNLMQIWCSLAQSVILNAMATQYTYPFPQRCLPSPLTSIVTSSLFRHVPSSPLSLAARLHQCCTYCSHYMNNGWTISGKASYIRFPPLSTIPTYFPLVTTTLLSVSTSFSFISYSWVKSYVLSFFWLVYFT